MRKKFMKNKGITLIALVITIIVLLILAGVTIASLSGDNGILKRAVEGKDRTKIAEIEEMSKQVKTEVFMEEFIVPEDMGYNPYYQGIDNNYDKIIQKTELAEAIRRRNKGSIRKGNKVILADKKYEIIVTKDLDIKVQKYKEPKLNVGEIGLSYYMEDKKENEPIEIDLYFDVKREYPFFDEYLREYLKDKTTEEIEEIAFKWTDKTTQEEKDNTRKNALEGFKQGRYADYNEFLILSCFDNKKLKEEYVNSITKGRNLEELQEMALQYENMLTTSDGYFGDVEYLSYDNIIERLIKGNNPKVSNKEELIKVSNCLNEEEFIKKNIIGSFYSRDYAMKVNVSNNNAFGVCHNISNNSPLLDEGMYANYSLVDSGNYTFDIVGGTGEHGTFTISNVKVETPSNRKINEIDKNKTIYASNPNIIKVMEGNVPIPKGFSYVQGTKEGGVVIKDSNENEFVWVPVDDYSKFKRQRSVDFDGMMTKEHFEKYYGEIDENGENKLFMKERAKAEKKGWDVSEFDETPNTKEEAKKMYASVKKNKGFYIGRYEAGCNEKRVYDNPTLPVASVKKNMLPYVHINWSKPRGLNDLGGAVEVSRKMYKDNLNVGVESTLCYGVQWDAALNFIDPDFITNEKTEGTPNCKKDSYVFNGEGKGKYMMPYERHHLNNTGTYDAFMFKNIYDMAGNVAEWTMETADWYNGRTQIGGRQNRWGYLEPASHRVSKNQEYDDNRVGFRVSLFIKD